MPSHSHSPPLLRVIRPRLYASAALGISIILGLSVRSEWADLPRGVSKPIGVGLWAMAAYWGVLLLRPTLRPLIVASIALALSWAIEFLQITPVSRTLSAHHNALRLIFGETFNSLDLIYLFAGVLLALSLHGRLSQRFAPPSTHQGSVDPS